jgi:hypothetical protein
MDPHSTPLSRSFAVLLIVILLLGISALVPARWIGAGKSLNRQPKLVLDTTKSTQRTTLDQNMDGSVSWNEVMDNTLNLTPADKENLSKIPVNKKVIDELNDPNNLTADFSKNLYLTAATINQNGGSDDPATSDVAKQLAQVEADKVVAKTYRYSDIIVAKTESKESIKAYGNALEPILAAVMTKETIETNVTSVTSFLKSKNASDLTPLLNDKKKLDGLIKKLLAMSVPPSAVPYHLIALTRITMYRDTLANFAAVESDPIRTNIALNSYADTIVLTGKLLEQFTQYFDSKNIAFTAQEPGYIFTSGYTKSN